MCRQGERGKSRKHASTNAGVEASHDARDDAEMCLVSPNHVLPRRENPSIIGERVHKKTIKKKFFRLTSKPNAVAASAILLALLALIIEFHILSPIFISSCPPPTSESTTFLCHLDSNVLGYLLEKGVLDPNYAKMSVLPIRRRYTAKWGGEDTCWLANQLLVTEALGGYHPHCNVHAQNRNMLYALSTMAGSMRPTTEAVKLMGSVLQKFHFDEGTMSRSYQMKNILQDEGNEMSHKQRMVDEKVRVTKELEGPGLSILPRQMDQDWLNRLTKKLCNLDFTSVSEGWSVKGLDPSTVVANGWHGSFNLYDLNQLMEIEEVQQVAYDPFILDVLQDSLGAPPIIRSVDVFMSVPKQDGSQTKFSFDTWHKDFNSPRSIKVFVYLTDALDEDHGPHTYIPFTQDVMGPASVSGDSFKLSGYETKQEYDELVNAYALSLSLQVLPEEYIKANLFTQKTETLLGPKGLVWIEDTHIFHKAESTKKDWRGLLLIDYTSTGFCGKDHVAFQNALSKVPEARETKAAKMDFPRLFQRMQVGRYMSPNPKVVRTDAPARVLHKVETLEDRFGPLLYNKAAQEQNPKTHEEYVEMGFKETGHISRPIGQSFLAVPCWEYECQECLTRNGSCSYCEEHDVCTCTCDHGFHGRE